MEYNALLSKLKLFSILIGDTLKGKNMLLGEHIFSFNSISLEDMISFTLKFKHWFLTLNPHATELIFLTPLPAIKFQLFHTLYIIHYI